MVRKGKGGEPRWGSRVRGKRQREGEVRREEGKRKVEERREKEKGGWGRQPPPQPRWRRERQERKQRERKGEEEGKGKEKEREKRRGKGDRKRGRREGIRASRRRGDRAHGGGGTGVAARGKPLFLCFSVLCLSFLFFFSVLPLMLRLFFLFAGKWPWIQQWKNLGDWIQVGSSLAEESHGREATALCFPMYLFYFDIFVHFYAAVSLN